MELWQAIILGIVQGISEFLPISSSGHLVVLQRMFGLDLPGITFDIVLHLGSLAAIFVVFWQDILALIKKPFQKMTGLLVVGTLPVVVAGFLFREQILGIFHQAFFLALAFIFTGALLWVADGLTKGTKNATDITWLDALIIGGMQAVGLPPGISRSGATITGALACGLNRETAARFSFLLAIIAITGAGVMEAFDLYQATEPVFYREDVLPFMIGFAASALASYLSIRLLLQLLKSCKLRYFSYYLFVLAAWLLVDHFVLNWFF